MQAVFWDSPFPSEGYNFFQKEAHMCPPFVYLAVFQRQIREFYSFSPRLFSYFFLGVFWLFVLDPYSVPVNHLHPIRCVGTFFSFPHWNKKHFVCRRLFYFLFPLVSFPRTLWFIFFSQRLVFWPERPRSGLSLFGVWMEGFGTGFCPFLGMIQIYCTSIHGKSFHFLSPLPQFPPMFLQGINKMKRCPHIRDKCLIWGLCQPRSLRLINLRAIFFSSFFHFNIWRKLVTPVAGHYDLSHKRYLWIFRTIFGQ